MELTTKRAKLDEVETHFYGFSSTDVYMDYRELINKKLTVTMVEIAEYYEEYKNMDKEYVVEMLLNQYKSFWDMAEPSFERFYKEVTEALEVPLSAVPKAISPEIAFCPSKIEKLEADIEELQEEYYLNIYYLNLLKQRQNSWETTYQSTKEKVDSAMKIEKTNMKVFENLKQSDKEMVKNMGTFLENLAEKNFRKFVSSDVKITKTKSNIGKKMLEKFRNMRMS